MRAILTCAILGLIASGCATTQQTDATHRQVTPAARKTQQDLKEVSNPVVIGRVIGIKSRLVQESLKREGIFCTVVGNEFHDISVPEHRRQEATKILKRDSKQNRYKIIWETP